MAYLFIRPSKLHLLVESTFVYLEGDFDLIWERMQSRGIHYMKPEMLESQFEILESPKNALQVNIDRPITEIVQEIIDSVVS